MARVLRNPVFSTQRGPVYPVSLRTHIGLSKMPTTVHLQPAFAFNVVTDTLTHSQLAQANPGYLQSYVDQNFNTTITRISGDVGTTITGFAATWGNDAHVAYFRRSAWNADDSLFWLETTGAGRFMLDGRTFIPKYMPLNMPDNDQMWHPNLPDKVIGTTSGNTVASYIVSTDTQTTLHTFTGYTSLFFGNNSGNCTLDGSRVLINAVRTSDAKNVLFVYNIDTDVKSADIDPSVYPGSGPLGSSSISPLGNVIEVGYADDHFAMTDISGVYKYSTSISQPTHMNDMVIDGVEYMVGRCDGGVHSGLIVKMNLNDGVITELTTTGYGVDTTTRSKGFAAVSDMDNVAPYNRGEMILVYCDGSNSNVYRLGDSRNFIFDFESNTQPMISTLGDRACFASDWNNSTTGRPVMTYVINIPAGITTAGATVNSPQLFLAGSTNQIAQYDWPVPLNVRSVRQPLSWQVSNPNLFGSGIVVNIPIMPQICM